MSDLMIEKITHCPSCGSAKIKKVRRKWAGEYRSRPYSVGALQYHECPDCGEKVYSPQAMRVIEATSPAFSKPIAK